MHNDSRQSKTLRRQRGLRHQQGLRCQQGFTLVEIMVVVVILGALAAIVGQSVLGSKDDADQGLAKTTIRNIAGAVTSYMIKNGNRIPTLEDLCEPDDKGQSFLETTFDGGLPTDPWQNEYVVEESDIGRFDVRSFGPDGEDGTEDDIALRGNQER